MGDGANGVEVRPTSRIPQLDGLRGVAIILVVFCHAWVGFPPHNRRLIPWTSGDSGGGTTGVTLFFVLSGFLITSLLLREQERTGSVDLRAFYGRRARRLLPALFAILGVYGFYAAFWLTGDRQTDALGSIGRALYIEDFEKFITWIPSDGYLGHTWSLAVEEQFYLVWPVLFLFAVAKGRRAVGLVAAAGVVGTVVIRFGVAWLGVAAGAGHLLHWDALMLGCLLAAYPVRVPKWLGWAACAFLGVSLFMPMGEIWLVTAVCGVALMHATDTRWLSNSVLRYFGRISYGLYLWHGLVLHFGWPVVPSVVLSIVVADLSFRFVESPFLLRRQRQHQPVTATSSDD